MQCPSAQSVIEYFAAPPGSTQRSAFDDHLDGCPACRELVAALATAQTNSRDGGFEDTIEVPAPRSTDHLNIGHKVGRYLVVESIGKGGMGHVLRAYDPKLQREVALKVVRSDLLDDDTRIRMLREARAMARLSHPNVVGLYDAEDSDSGLVLVMEFVEGETLREWRTRGDRTWREVLEQFVQAGRGLAAAHEHGLLHRDFKPANVLVSKQGEVKVTDFGLAKLEVHPNSSASGDNGDEVDATLTQADTVMGTPRYMAPEQHRSAALDARADQYAFCVALFEALTSQAPFPGRTIAALDEEKRAGPPPWPSSARGVPPTIIATVRRGLAVSPDERWPSLDALLAELAFDPAARRRRIIAGATALVAAVGAASYAAVTTGAERCTGAASQLSATWDPARRDRVEAAMRGVDVPYADTAWRRASERLDTFASDWQAAYTESCAATSIRAEQSVDVMDLRMACLHRARLSLDAAAQVLEDADVGVVQNIDGLLGTLAPLERCGDIDALQAEVPPPPPEDREVVDRIYAALARINAFAQAGRFDVAQEELERARADSKRVDYGPVQTTVSVLDGMILMRLAKLDEAERALRNGLRDAITFGQTEERRKAALALMLLVGSEKQNVSEALRYREIAEAGEDDDPVWQAKIANALAILNVRQGNYDEAEDQARRVLKLRQDALGPEHPDVAQAMSNLAVILDDRGHYEESEAQQRRSIEIRVRALGEKHPALGASRHNLAFLLRRLGRFEEAEQEERKALAVSSEALGPTHPMVAISRANIGKILHARGDLQRAQQEHEQALKLWRDAYGENHDDVAQGRDNLGRVLMARGRLQDAREEFERALEVRLELHGPDHWKVGASRFSLGRLLAAQGDLEAARLELTKARDILTDVHGERHPDVAGIRSHLADVLLRLGDSTRALAEARRAWDDLRSTELDPAQRGHAAFALARAVEATDSSPEARDRARTLAADALRAYEASSGQHRRQIREIRRWRTAPTARSADPDASAAQAGPE